MDDGGAADIDEEEDRAGMEVGDPDAHTVRVLSRRCTTCVFYRDDRMHLGDERREGFIAEVVAKDSYVVCHQTIRRDDGVRPAVCRGFWNAHREEVTPLQIVDRLGLKQDVEPPARPYPDWSGVSDATPEIRD